MTDLAMLKQTLDGSLQRLVIRAGITVELLCHAPIAVQKILGGVFMRRLVLIYLLTWALWARIYH